MRRIILSGHSSAPLQKEKYYLFIFERINLDSINFSMISRRMNLNHREEEIVKLLFKGDEN